MECSQCKLKIPHKHMTKEDHKFIEELFMLAEEKIPNPEFGPFYNDKMSNRKNHIIWFVNEKLIELGKRVKFPVPDKLYDKYGY